MLSKYNQCITNTGRRLDAQTLFDKNVVNEMIQEQQGRARKACLPDMPSL